MQCNSPIYFGTCFITAALLLNPGMSHAQTGYDIYMLDVKSGKTTQVSKIAGNDEYNPCFSNNGKKIVHDVVGPLASPFSQTIYVTDVGTGVSTPLTGAEGGNDAAWSPDGETIAFDDWNDYPQSIFTVPSSGGTRTLVRYNSHHASWNPGSNKIAFDDNGGYIGTKDLLTGNETFVTYYGDRPAWSPNGQYIAFDGWSWIGGGIWIIKVDTLGNPVGSPIQLTTSGYGPTWKNNSHEIVFVDWPDGDPNLYSIPFTGGTAIKVGGRVGGFDKGDYDAAYSNNGQYIAWASYTDPPVSSNNSLNKSSLAKSPQESKLNLMQNSPNPFNNKTIVGFTLGQTTHVTLNIYNLSGQKIQTLTDADYQAGTYSLQWDGRSQGGQALPDGVYLYQLRTENGTQVKKMILKK